MPPISTFAMLLPPIRGQVGSLNVDYSNPFETVLMLYSTIIWEFAGNTQVESENTMVDSENLLKHCVLGVTYTNLQERLQYS